MQDTTLLDTGYLFGRGFDNTILPLLFVTDIRVLFQTVLSLILLFLVMYDGVNNVVSCLWLFFKIILLVDVLYYFFILTLHIFNLFFQVLKLFVESLDLLVAPDVSRLAHWLSDCRIGGGVKLRADPTDSILHL